MDERLQNYRPLVARPVRKDDASYPAVRALYREAFPFKERFSLPTLRFAARKKEIDFIAYFEPDDPDELCGISYTIEAGSYLYVLYLAVQSGLRGKGIGSRILQHLRAEHPACELVLEIEPLDKTADNYEQRAARLAFYQRNGFARVGYDMFEGRVRYTMLATGEAFDVDDFSRAVRKLSHGLYRFKIVPAQDEGAQRS